MRVVAPSIYSQNINILGSRPLVRGRGYSITGRLFKFAYSSSNLYNIVGGQLQRHAVVEFDKVCRPLADHHAGAVGATARDAGHDRGVGDAQIAHPAKDAQP